MGRRRERPRREGELRTNGRATGRTHRRCARKIRKSRVRDLVGPDRLWALGRVLSSTPLARDRDSRFTAVASNRSPSLPAPTQQKFALLGILLLSSRAAVTSDGGGDGYHMTGFPAPGRDDGQPTIHPNAQASLLTQGDEDRDRSVAADRKFMERAFSPASWSATGLVTWTAPTDRVTIHSGRSGPSRSSVQEVSRRATGWSSPPPAFPGRVRWERSTG